MEFSYITKKQAITMHAVLIESFGGIQGLRDEGLLESALAGPRQSAFGEDLYPDLFSKAAAYGFSLSENQPFLDGNKRIAVSVMMTFLMVNHYVPTCSQEDLYEAMIQLANKKMTREELARWLKKNTKKIKK